MKWDRLHASGHSIRVVLVLALFAAALMTGGSDAQQPAGPGLPQPRLLTIMPMGGKAGTTVEVVLAGQDVEEPQGLLFSHPKIKAELVPVVEPTPDPKAPKGKVKAAVPTSAMRYKVTIAADVPLGIHDVRIFNKWGVSNPRAFVVGDQTEVLAGTDQGDVSKAQKVELNTTINGVISVPTRVDYYAFAGKKGQRVLAGCLASSIDSRANPVVELYDSAGKRLAVNRNYDGQDALADATLPADGEYFARVFQFTHTGGTAEYFYRLTISTAPWIDVIYPAVVEPGKSARVTVYGRNLPGGQPDPTAVLEGRTLEKATVNLAAPTDPAAWQRLSTLGYVTPPSSLLDGFEYRLKSSNPSLVTYARAPVVLANGANTQREAAQEVKVPCEIAARLDKKHPLGWYQFSAAKGAVLSVEVQSDRLGAGTDLVMALYNADTKALITEQDDDPETLSINQFFTRTTDPARYRFVAPADGKYQLMVRSQDTTQLSPRNYYHVRISPEQPDFRLVVMPCSAFQPDAAVLRRGGNQDYAVYAWRHDNFNGAIKLTAEGLPPGVSCKEQTISPGLKTGLLVLSAAADAGPWTGEIKIKGTATINGQPVVREARAASIIWPAQPQGNIPTFTRLDRSLVLAVRDQAPFALTSPMDKASVLQGEKLTIPLKLERIWPDFKVAVQVVPANLTGVAGQAAQNQPITVAPVTIAADKSEGNAVVDVKANVPPGDYTVVLRGSGQIPFAKDPMAKKANATIVLPATPVVVTVLPKQLGTVTVTPPNATGKLGTPVEVVVKVARLYDFAGEFKVQLVLPPNAKGIAAPDVTIPPGKDEAKLVINVAADATPGNLANLLIKALAAYNPNHMTTQEAKFALNLTK